MNARETMLMAAQLCREVAERDYRPLGLVAHATGAELCARTLEIRAEGLPSSPDLATELLAARAKLEAAEKLAEALKETRAELAKHVDLNAPLRKPYEHPLSVYDRAGEALAAWEAAQ